MDTYTIKTYSSFLLPANYINFLFAKWMKSFRFGNDYIKLTESDHYYQAYQLYIGSILKEPNTVIRLAVLSSDPDVALGFSVMKSNLLHYCYVGKDYRRQGIGGKLVPVPVKEFTHLTRMGLRVWALKCPMAKFKPFQ